jgi:hypothetical protein
VSQDIQAERIRFGSSVTVSLNGDVGEVVKSGRYGKANQKTVPDSSSSLSLTPYFPAGG